MCDSCQIMYINGHKCHELGCPDAWKDKKHECAWCGNTFIPEDKYQKFCDDSCYNAYNGYPEEE